MTVRRRKFSPNVYRQILVKQGWRCGCGCREFMYDPGAIRWDHILPLSLGGRDEPENLQALLVGHHQRKTNREASARAKTKRIQAQDGLLKKKESLYDKIMVKALAKCPRTTNG